MSSTTTSDTPWKIPGKWSISRHCFEPEVRKDWHLPESIIIHDCTLGMGSRHRVLCLGRMKSSKSPTH